MSNDRLLHEIAKTLLKMGATGVRLMDNGVDAKINARALRVEVKER